MHHLLAHVAYQLLPLDILGIWLMTRNLVSPISYSATKRTASLAEVGYLRGEKEEEPQ